MRSPDGIQWARMGVIILLAIVMGYGAPAYADSFVVNSVDDDNDGLCDAAHCSLREAINAANLNPGSDTISFAGLDASGGSLMIYLLSPLPPLLDDATTIDGTTVGGYSGTPLIDIGKASGVIEDGLALQSANNVVRGLSLAGFGSWPGGPNPAPTALTGGAIVITGSGNLVEGNVLGWGAWPNSIGLRLAGGGNTATGNVISGNGVGIYLQGPGQLIQGNRIGTDATGNTPIPNGVGIYDQTGSGGGHTIGSAAPGQGNVISGNTDFGLVLSSANNVVQGNRIGTNAAGTAALGNKGGIKLLGATNNTIGGVSPSQANLISGNSMYGIMVWDASEGARILGNLIGSDASGTNAIGTGDAVYVFGHGLTVGGYEPGAGNLILGNWDGVHLENEGNQNAVLGNTITQNARGIYRVLPSPSAQPTGFTFSRNSIFDNTERGIRLFDWEYNLTTEPPVITKASRTSASGTTCPGCVVEIFVAAPDAYGAGEGKTYLASTTADSNGDFSATFPIAGYCTSLTATSTTTSGNTSEFSNNVKAQCFHIGPLFLIPVWVFIITVFGAGGYVVGRHRPERLRITLPGGLLAGALVGGLLFLAGNALPGFTLSFSPEETIPYQAELPTCDEYLDLALLTPADGAVVDPTQDVLLGWMPVGDLPDGLRWVVGAESLMQGYGEQTTEESALPLSAFALSAQPGDTVIWSVRGERDTGQGAGALPFCSAGDHWTFKVASLPVKEPVPVETEETVPTTTPTPEAVPPAACAPLVTALMNITCRKGPDSAYEELGYLLQGETAVPEGQSVDGLWVWIPNPDWLGYCFVWGGGVEAQCVERLSIIQAPPLPTATTTPAACLPTLDRVACGDAGGVWSADTASCLCP